MPFCKCQAADVGRFCEYKRRDECDPTMEEKASGVTRENRCTDEEHGTCVVVLGETKCDCRAGYVGEMCETYDPCADNPCWNSECIPIPSETVIEKGGEQKQTYRCLCAMGDEMSGPNRCVYSGTGNCSSHDRCHEGQCVTCEHSEEEDMLQICDEEQMKEGFRCICKPGFMPPYCEKMADACAEHLCENGAVCQATSRFDYTCQCPPGTRGSLCEEVTDICLAMGNARCQDGTCYPDAAVVRGFSCDCEFGAYGRDCQFRGSLFDTWKNLVWEHYYVFLPAFAVTGNFLILVVLYLICSGPIKPKEKPVDVEKNDTKKPGQKPKISKKSVTEKKAEAPTTKNVPTTEKQQDSGPEAKTAEEAVFPVPPLQPPSA